MKAKSLSRVALLILSCLLGGLFAGVLLPLVSQPTTLHAQPATKTPDDVAALKSELASLKAQLPDQSHAMADVAYHFSNLWFAAQKKNWPLAKFYLDETRSHLNWAVRLKPVRKTSAGQEIDLHGILQAVENTQLAEVKKAVEARDGGKFAVAYRLTLEACYACHKASEKPYLRPQIPERADTPIINFDPDAKWPE